MKICPLMRDSEIPVYCTPECSWFDPQRDGCIVFSMRLLMEGIAGDMESVEKNIRRIEANMPQLYRG